MNCWNELPEKVRSAPSQNAFKNRLDKFLERYDIMYDYENCTKYLKDRMSLATGSGKDANDYNDMEMEIHAIELFDLEIQAQP